jgi:hypothetical protein
MYYYAQVTHIGYPAGRICKAPGHKLSKEADSERKRLHLPSRTRS